jgi:hypothetical protein
VEIVRRLEELHALSRPALVRARGQLERFFA